MKAKVINDIIPVPGTVGYGTVGRTLRTPFLDEWSSKRDEARRNGERLWAEIAERIRGGVSVAEIIRHLAEEAETALARAPRPHRTPLPARCWAGRSDAAIICATGVHEAGRVL